VSGPLCGLVMHHGPTNSAARFVLVAIAEEQRLGPEWLVKLSARELAARTCLGQRTVEQALALLIEDGWVIHTAGVGRAPSTYRLCLERFPAPAVAQYVGTAVVPQEPRHNDNPQPVDNPVVPQEPRHNDSVVPQEPRHKVRSTAGAAAPYPSKPVRDSVYPAPEMIPGLLGLVAGGADGQTPARRAEPKASLRPPDPVAAVFVNVPADKRPSRFAAKRDIRDLVAAGWTLDQLRAAIDGQNHDYSRINGGAVLTGLRDLKNYAPPAAPPPSGECTVHPGQPARNCALCRSERIAAVPG
jgi:hypothetical protein